LDPHLVNDRQLMRALVNVVPQFKSLVDIVHERLEDNRTVYLLAAWFYLTRGDAPNTKTLRNKRAVNVESLEITDFRDACQRWKVIIDICLEAQPEEPEEAEEEEQEEEQEEQEEQEEEQEEEKEPEEQKEPEQAQEPQEPNMFNAPTDAQMDLTMRGTLTTVVFTIPANMNPQALRENREEYARGFKRAFDALVDRYADAEVYLPPNKRQRRE